MIRRIDIQAIRSRILTTTACNARCAYCYEKGSAILWMCDQTADETACFLAERAKETEGPVFLEWFGGEPTLNLKAVDRISAYLHDNGVPYKSSIVTNGLLADKCLEHNRIARWNLILTQITLDGTAQFHEKVKGFPAGSFDRILQNIIALTEAGVRVKLRLNYAGNDEELCRLIDDLKNRFQCNPRIFPYVSAVYPEGREIPKESMQHVLQLQERIIEVGLASRQSLYGFGERCNRCFMMSPTSFTITPDGKLYNCSHNMSDGQCVGSVRQYEPNHPIRQAFLSASVSKECELCDAYPICKGGCRIGELGLAQMPQCHPFKNVMSDIQYAKSVMNLVL